MIRYKHPTKKLFLQKNNIDKNIFLIYNQNHKINYRGLKMKTCKVITENGLVVWCELTPKTIEAIRKENHVKIITGGKK